MSDAEQQSPRAAIRKWLQITDSKSLTRPADALPEQQNSRRGFRYHSRRGQWTRCPSETKGPHDEEAAREHRRHSKSGSRQKHVTERSLLVNPLQARPRKHSEASTTVITDGHGLAERLGLHPPFRTFKDRSDDNIAEAQSRPRKRRHSKSSTSSYLEPAAANDLSDNDHARSSHATILSTVSERPAVGDRDNYVSPTASKGGEVILPSPEKLLKPYEKRPRHKTRIDRYELKESSRHGKKTKQDAKKDRGDKKQKKQKRKEKSGAALMHGFAAQNVVHDRLTLKPARTLGLFGKGRASSPVRRRGLPDLAFSEMTFLSSRREKPKDSIEDSSNKPSDKKKRRLSTKEPDAEADFSRYFLSAKPTTVELNTSHRQRYQQQKRQSRNHDSPQACVDLPERPFLGFGTRGPNTSTSPVKSPVNRDSVSLRRGDPRSPTPSTGYLTWSQSRGPSQASPPPDRRHHVEPLESSKFSNRKRPSPSPPKAQHSLLPVSPHRIQTTSSGAQGSASRPPSKHENPNKAMRQNSKSRVAIDERLRSREKSKTRGDAVTIELNAAQTPQYIKGSIPDITSLNEAATHGCADIVVPTSNQAPPQSSGHEPRQKPPAHSLRPVSAQMQMNTRHKDPLDDILEALLKDCRTNAARRDTACRNTMGHRNFPVREEKRLPVGTHEDSPDPAFTFIGSINTTVPLASASGSSRGPCSANPQLAPAHVESMSTHTLSRGSLHASNRASLGYPGGYPSSPVHNQTDARNAWNGYDALYARQNEQADVVLQSSIGHPLPNGAVQDDFVGMLGKSDHGVGAREQTLGRYSAELRDGFDEYRTDSSKSLQEENKIDSAHVGRGEWYDQHADYQASNESGESIFDVSRRGVDNGAISLNDADDYYAEGRSFAQTVDEQEIESQRFTTNVSNTYHSWQPRNLFSGTYGLEACPTRAWVQDVDSALSGFWTPHKLY